MEKDPKKELWDGIRYGEDGAKQFGTDLTYSFDRLNDFLPDIINHKSAVFCDRHSSSLLSSKNINLTKKRFFFFLLFIIFIILLIFLLFY